MSNSRDNLETSFRCCELKSKSKVPAHANWQNEDKTLDEATALFEAQQSNIGLLLGHKSNIIDIDCDSQEAVIIAEHLVIRTAQDICRLRIVYKLHRFEILYNL